MMTDQILVTMDTENNNWLEETLFDLSRSQKGLPKTCDA